MVDKNIDVYWGGYSQIASEMILYNEAFRRGKYGYFHLLSGTTLPIKVLNILMLSVKNMQECNLLAFGIKILKIILTE